MLSFPTSIHPPRCIQCNYILSALEEPRCPECGRHFDPANPKTYLDKPRFVFWQYWLPGVLVVAAISTIWALIWITQGVGIAATLVVPFALGGLFGYGTRRSAWLAMAAGILGAVFAVFLLFAAGFQGLFCAIVLMAILFVPLMVGVGTGFLLRMRLKESNFAQRWHLPVWFFLAFPLVWAKLEGPVSLRYGQVRVTTTKEMNTSLEDAWAGVTMYEDVQHAPPLLLRLGLSRPLYSVGTMTHVGDIKTCVYDQGKLVKRITRVEPGKEIAFEVIHQSIERCAARLVGGSFRFDAISPTQSHVTLTTVYEPFLAPRFAWQPFEELSAHTLHNHVLYGMMINAQDQLHGWTQHASHELHEMPFEHDHHQAHP